MRRLLFLLTIALFCAAAHGKSIFDDDYTPPKEAPTESPEWRHAPPRPAPEQPAPAPEQPVQLPADDSRRNDIRPPVVPPSEGWGAKAPHPDKSAQDALAAAQESLVKAEHTAERALLSDKTYLAARERARLDAEKGMTDSPAFMQAKRLHDAYLSKDAGYIEAKRYVMMLTLYCAAEQNVVASRFEARVPIAPKSAEQLKQEIADGVLNHDLVEGMTYVEACKSARKPVELVSSAATRKTYRWTLKGPTGSYQVAHRGFRGGLIYETVNTYGVIGHVVGIFDDDYLVSFSRTR